MLQIYDLLVFLSFCLTLLAVIALTGRKGRDDIAKDALHLLGSLFGALSKKK